MSLVVSSDLPILRTPVGPTSWANPVPVSNFESVAETKDETEDETVNELANEAASIATDSSMRAGTDRVTREQRLALDVAFDRTRSHPSSSWGESRVRSPGSWRGSIGFHEARVAGFSLRVHSIR